MKATGWWLVIACAASLSVRAQESGEVSSTKDILTLEHAWFDAEARRDNLTLDRIFDNALVYIEDGKLVTKGEYLSRMRLAGSQRPQIVVENPTVRIFGSTAIVVGTYREAEIKNGKTVAMRFRFIDTWVYKQGSWILVAAGSSPLAK